MEDFMQYVLYGAGAVALLALAYLFWRVTKTLAVLDTTIAEASSMLASVRSDVLPLADKAGVTIDALNAELLRVDGIITTIENATKNVQKTSSSVSEFVNAPVEAVTDLAGRVRTAFREKRAEVKDAARRAETADHQHRSGMVDTGVAFDEAYIEASASGCDDEGDLRGDNEADLSDENGSGSGQVDTPVSEDAAPGSDEFVVYRDSEDLLDDQD